MNAMNRILIPTDFSLLAGQALRYACDLAHTYRAELHVLHVVSPAREVPVTPDGAAGVGAGGVVFIESLQDLVKQRTAELKDQVERRAADLAHAPIAVVRTGIAWNEIVRYADEACIDVIVIGSHARGVMKRILLGSTSKSVLEHAACPVLMVPIAAIGTNASTPSQSDDRLATPT